MFLDEIGNLSLPMQAKLLTAIEKQCITRLGAVNPIHIDVRLICATNANLHQLVAEGNSVRICCTASILWNFTSLLYGNVEKIFCC